MRYNNCYNKCNYWRYIKEKSFRWHWINVRKIARQWLNGNNYYIRFARLQSRIFHEERHVRRLHKILAYLTSAFETIDKAHLENSLAEYVTHLPRMTKLRERRASQKRRHATKSDVNKQNVAKRMVPFILPSHREYAEKPIASLAQTYIFERKTVTCACKFDKCNLSKVILKHKILFRNKVFLFSSSLSLSYFYLVS